MRFALKRAQTLTEIRNLICLARQSQLANGTRVSSPESSTPKAATATAFCASPTPTAKSSTGSRARFASLNFSFVVEHIDRTATKPIDVVRIVGGLAEHLRFFHTVDPAISRKRDIAGQAVKSEARLAVVSIEPLGKAMRLYDITTGTEDFIANGVVSHNCYARPSHAYVGLSPGLDFETKLFYKADAARVLEKELAAPSYKCAPIMLGANTDPYQPLEKTHKVTRSLLEVLLKHKHPVSITTKGALVARDVDLLAELARDGLTRVMFSIPTLDNDMKRVLEPRAAAAAARLKAMRVLADAGVPVGVLVAPIIPVLTEHEIEAVLEASREAGASLAGYTMLRLPVGSERSVPRMAG